MVAEVAAEAAEAAASVEGAGEAVVAQALAGFADGEAALDFGEAGDGGFGGGRHCAVVVAVPPAELEVAGELDPAVGLVRALRSGEDGFSEGGRAGRRRCVSRRR